MTVIENIYDAIAAKIQVALPDYYRLPNPYNIEASNFLTRSCGYAIACGPGTQTNIQFGCSVSWERVFQVTLCQKMVASDNDTSGRENIDKKLLADHRKLLEAFYNDLSLNGIATDVDVIDDGGVEVIGVEEKFLGIECTVLLKYEDDLRV